jgi:hypothetical protein
LTTSEGASDPTANAYAQSVLPPPSEELLARIYRLTSKIRGWRRRDVQDEELAESALRLMVGELESLDINEMPLPATAAQANALVAAADEWASLASSICCRLYAPASPMPKRLLKWSRKVAALLREICSIVQRAISSAARVLGASSWTVTASFPWGVSLGLNFDTSAGPPTGELDEPDQTVQELQQRLTEAQDALSEAQDTIRLLKPLVLDPEVHVAIVKLKKLGSAPPSQPQPEQE